MAAGDGSGAGTPSRPSLAANDHQDPFAHILRPPPGESNVQRGERVRKEAEAKRVSDAIDKQLKEDAQKHKKEKAGEHKILLLGQAAAGKTTVLKQMRLLYAPRSHEKDRLSWRAVVQLNVIIGVREVLEAVELYDRDNLPPSTSSNAAPNGASGSGGGRSSRQSGNDDSGHSSGEYVPLTITGLVGPSTSDGSLRGGSPSNSVRSGRSGDRSNGHPTHSKQAPSNRALLARLRLAPLLSLEPVLRRRLGAVSETDDLSTLPAHGRAAWQARADPLAPSRNATNLLLRAGWQDRLFSRVSTSSRNKRNSQISKSSAVNGNGIVDEFDDRDDAVSITESAGGASVRKGMLRRRSSSALGAVFRGRSSSLFGSDAAPGKGIAAADDYPPPLPDLSNVVAMSAEDDPAHLLYASRHDITELWSDPITRRLRRKGRLEAAESAAYYLDNLDRICEVGFMPTDEDIMHARVRTVGITEERFQVARGLYYRICDVGGSRSQRSFWAPYFDDAEAIIFLAPISAFDQRLIEDPRVNRVDDSLQLFSQIVENRLLTRVSLILFLNKIDILERKLRSGIQVSRYFPEYDGKNDFEEVWRWFRARFKKIVSSKRSVAPTRPIYVHTTVATSTRQIKAILMSVNDTILRNNLRATGMA